MISRIRKLSISNLDPNNNNVDKKSYINILIYYIRNRTKKDVKSLYLIIKNANEENNGNKYLTLYPTDERGDKLKIMKKYEAKLKILLDQ